MEAVAGVVDGADCAQAAVGVRWTMVSVVLVGPVGPSDPARAASAPNPDAPPSRPAPPISARRLNVPSIIETQKRGGTDPPQRLVAEGVAGAIDLDPRRAAEGRPLDDLHLAPGRRPSCTRWASAGVS